jgi:hypothetical protein
VRAGVLALADELQVVAVPLDRGDRLERERRVSRIDRGGRRIVDVGEADQAQVECRPVRPLPHR